MHERETLAWPFQGAPFVRVQYGNGTRDLDVDPFPCYQHDRFAANDHLQHVVKCLPLEMDVTVNLLSYDTPHRVNALAEMVESTATAGAPSPWHGSVVMMGKRTPIHTAVTKYLVAHEYGHLVQRAIEIKAGLKPYAFAAIYAKLRGLEQQTSEYGGGTWHLDPGELFANDFRLLVCRSEVSFWPHLDIPRPETLPQLALYWEGVARDFKREAKDRAGHTTLALAS